VLSKSARQPFRVLSCFLWFKTSPTRLTTTRTEYQPFLNFSLKIVMNCVSGYPMRKLTQFSLIFLGLFQLLWASPILSRDDTYKSVVRIDVSSQVYDFMTPWNSGRFGGGSGTGFLIGENQFITNAHVVSNATRILVTVHGSSHKHEARVKYIAHDCDLAMIEVLDFTPFQDLPYLEVKNDEVPPLESEVKVIGYPMGGERLAITLGVVSRIDFRGYVHSQMDSHLVIQVDAAINPGNSGGPALQDGKVIGVAFQGISSADNTGYIIPTPVLNRFLKDVEDGSYDTYVDLNISHAPLTNEATRQYLGLKPSDPGVLVTQVKPGSSAEGLIQKGDILTAIDGFAIDRAGMINYAGEFTQLEEIAERKFYNDQVELTVIRDGKKMQKAVPLRPYLGRNLYAVEYETRPKYFVKGGLVFQPLSYNLYQSYGNQFEDFELTNAYANYVDEGIFKTKEDLITITRVEPDPINAEWTSYRGLLVESINDLPILNLRQAYEILENMTDREFHIIRFVGQSKPLVLPVKELVEADRRIQAQYNIQQLFHF